jgi:hypothetical protein
MQKKWWKRIIWFWLLIIIGAIIAVAFIGHQQKQAREAFVASFDYNLIAKVDDQHTAAISYTMAELLTVAQSIESTITADLTTAFTLINEHADEQKSFIDFYATASQQSLKVAHITLTDGALVKQKQYEKIADFTYTYAKIAAQYYIIYAKSINEQNETVQMQLEQTYAALITAQKELQTILTMYTKP